ncbi:MAG: MutS protein msh4 [Phylliscum demangeonii]|nr:MAG: MutS protein msh4 [Phylliscum demangeonii]
MSTLLPDRSVGLRAEFPKGDKIIQQLLQDVRSEIATLFRISDALAMLDMVASFGQLVTTLDYARPEFTDTLAIKAGRHPIREKIHKDRFVPNDVYAAQQSRFQIITGCNMSGKSTYIRSIALIAVMAQIGCFVPARFASMPVVRQLFARVSLDDSNEANVSTFAAEMRETAFILRNIDRSSLVIIDELGRGTSTSDGLAIALSVAEALVESRALVWFATHFTDLAKIMAARNGVVNLHLAVEMSSPSSMTMLYKVSDGCERASHYGLALAGILELPPAILEVSKRVSSTLSAQHEQRRRSSRASALGRRRKLILSLKEMLSQTRDGAMQGVALLTWLRKLQVEFVQRMTEIDHEADSEERVASNGSEDIMGTATESIIDLTTEKSVDSKGESSAAYVGAGTSLEETITEMEPEGEGDDEGGNGEGDDDAVCTESLLSSETGEDAIDGEDQESDDMMEDGDDYQERNGKDDEDSGARVATAEEQSEDGETPTIISTRTRNRTSPRLSTPPTPTGPNSSDRMYPEVYDLTMVETDAETDVEMDMRLDSQGVFSELEEL